MKTNRPSPCICGSQKTYACCCEPFHQRDQAAPTAEALMRSRYSAYALNLQDYLNDTWHASTRPIIEAPEAGLKWLGLTVHEAEQIGTDEAFVRFTARYKIGGGRAQKLQERSRFVRESGVWYYVDGEIGS